MDEIFILVVAVCGFGVVTWAAILAHRHLVPCRPLQGVEWKSTSRKKVCLERWQASILQLAVEQARFQRIEAAWLEYNAAKKPPINQ
jgi:hypothetical protein